MGIEVRWHDDSHTILCVHYPEYWTWDAYLKTFNEAKILIEAEPHGVFVIQSSVNGFKYLPVGSALSPMKSVAERRPKNMIKSFLVTDSTLSRNFIEMMLKVLPANRQGQPNVFVESVEEALAQIAQSPSG